MDFVRTFERQCGSQASVKRLRAHPAYHRFNIKWNLPVYFQIKSVIYSHHLHLSEIEFEHQFRWTELHLTAPSWRPSYYSLGNNLEQKCTRSIMIAKVLPCMTKELSFTFLSLASWECWTPRELDQAQLHSQVLCLHSPWRDRESWSPSSSSSPFSSFITCFK